MQTKSTSGCKGASQGSNCVIWMGQDIPAIGVKRGDNITDMLCSIAQKLVDVAAPLDLSTVSIQCLKDQLDISEPVERTIANMMQIAYDSSCDLKVLIDALNAKLSNQTPPLVLDLKCLATFDVYGNPLPYDEQSVLQTLVNTVCGEQTIVAGISGTVQTIQADVKALQAIPAYTEPTLSSCLFTGRQTSDALVITASALCTYMSEVGQTSDIQSAISQMPTGYTAEYGLSSGWIVNPTNFAQSYSNLLLVVSNLHDRIANIENNCCKANCDSIAVDFDVKLSEDRTSAILFFATKSNVPAGFTEVNPLGSKLIVKDANGNEYDTYIKVIPQLTNPDGITIDLANSPIDPSLDYTFGMSVTLTNGTLTCVKCINHSLTFKDTCAFCQISVTSTASVNTTDKIVIVYKASSTASSQYATIYAGQTQAIPKSSQISSVIVYGQAQYNSTCTLPSPSIPSCYELTWAYSLSTGGEDAVFTDALIQYISILGVQYPIGCAQTDWACLNATLTNSFYPVTVGLIGSPVFTSQGFPKFNSLRYTFTTTADIAATIKGFIGNPNAPKQGDSSQGTFDGFAGGAYVLAIPSNSPTCPSSGSGGAA